jgi:hypothetical protein
MNKALIPNARNQAPVGSRWVFNAETKGRVFVVTDRKPGGIVEYQQEGRAYFGRSYLRQFLANAHFVGEQQAG